MFASRDECTCCMPNVAEVTTCCSVASSSNCWCIRLSAEHLSVKGLSALVLQAEFVPVGGTDWCYSYWSGNVYDLARAYVQ